MHTEKSLKRRCLRQPLMLALPESLLLLSLAAHAQMTDDAEVRTRGTALGQE